MKKEMRKQIQAPVYRCSPAVALLLVVAVLFGAFSCSGEDGDTPAPTDNVPMIFSGDVQHDPDWVAASAPAAGGLSRATVPYPVGQSFGVMGFYTAAANFANYTDSRGTLPNLMYNQKVDYTSAGCHYANEKYWSVTPTDKYTFAAYSPWNFPGVTLTPQATAYAGGTLSLAITDKASAMSDFMLAPGRVNVTRADNPITFNFQHMLSRIRFAIAFGFEADSVRIDKVVFNAVKNTGTISPLYKATVTSTTMTVGTPTATVPVEAGPQDNWVAHYTTDAAGSIVDGFAAYMIPQGIGSASFDITLSTFLPGQAIPYVGTFNCKLSGSWVFQTAYLYKITLLSTTTFAFYVQIDDWTNETTGEINTDDRPLD